MKDSTNQILNILRDESLEKGIKDFQLKYPDHVHNEVTLKETLNNFLFIKEVLIEEIESGRLETISFTARSRFLQLLSSINYNRGNVNHLIQEIDSLHNEINVSGILYNRIGKTDLVLEKKSLTELKKRNAELITFLEGKVESLNFIEDAKNELTDLLNETKNSTLNLRQTLLESSSQKEQIDKLILENEERLNEMKTLHDSTEEKRLSISTFASNIDEYKLRIDKLEKQLVHLIDRKNEVNSLITSAKEALKMGSTVGISSAFAAQYDNANNGHKKNWWIFGSVLFLLSAISLTIWIVSDTANSEKLGVVIGRIVAVGISIAGAVFCAKQYVKQKHIAEDYAYKAVLSKSIVAFTEEIGAASDNPDQHIGNYLNKVLTEIHKDPLRERGRPKFSRGFTEKQIEQITEIIKSIKP